MTDTTENHSILVPGRRINFTVTTRGIDFTPACLRDEWLDIVKQLCGTYEATGRVHVRIMFSLGDALAFGERQFGEEFAQAIEDTRRALGITAKTASNAAYVAAKVESSRRRENLTLSHHEAVASLDAAGQDATLALAEREKMTVAELRNHVARMALTEADKATIAAQTEKPVEDMSASEIKRRLREASEGKPVKNELIVDLNSEEGVKHAAVAVGEWLALQNLDDFSTERRAAWLRALTPLADAETKLRTPLNEKTTAKRRKT